MPKKRKIGSKSKKSVKKIKTRKKSAKRLKKIKATANSPDEEDRIHGSLEADDDEQFAPPQSRKFGKGEIPESPRKNSKTGDELQSPSIRRISGDEGAHSVGPSESRKSSSDGEIDFFTSADRRMAGSLTPSYLPADDIIYHGIHGRRAHGVERRLTEAELVTLSYADDLERTLKLLWWPLKLAMRVPFQVIHKKKSIQVRVNRKSPWFYTACIMTGVLWIVLIWLTVGIAYLYIGLTEGMPSRFIRGENGIEIENPTYILRTMELDLFERFYVNVFIAWAILSHACIASLHLLYTCEDHASFVRDWYKAVDLAMLRVHRGLNYFIITHLVIIFIFCFLLWLTYYEAEVLPGIYGSSTVTVMALIRFLFSEEQVAQDLANGETVYFEKYAPLGLSLYIFSLISSRLNLLFFMVLCRIFRESSRLLNHRMEMSLGQRSVGGENAVHLDYTSLYQDHLQVSSLGKQTGNIFGFTVVSYYGIQMLCITLELSSIAYFDFKQEAVERENYPGTNILRANQPLFVIFDSISHLTISLFSFLYISYECSRAGEVAMDAFDIIRRQGLILSINQQERNFVRSMWYSGGAKNPILVQPSHMFYLNRELIADVLGSCFFYFILMWQFKRNRAIADERRSRGELAQ